MILIKFARGQGCGVGILIFVPDSKPLLVCIDFTPIDGSLSLSLSLSQRASDGDGDAPAESSPKGGAGFQHMRDVCGAGGGGFIMMLLPTEQIPRLAERLKPLAVIPTGIDVTGTIVLSQGQHDLRQSPLSGSPLRSDEQGSPNAVRNLQPAPQKAARSAPRAS